MDDTEQQPSLHFLLYFVKRGKKSCRTASESDKEDVIKVLKSRKVMLKEIDENVSFSCF